MRNKESWETVSLSNLVVIYYRYRSFYLRWYRWCSYFYHLIMSSKSSQVYTLEYLTIARPIAPIHSSFSFSVEAYIKYTLSGVATSKENRFDVFSSADFTVTHFSRSIVPWGSSPCFFEKYNLFPLSTKCLLRHSFNQTPELACVWCVSVRDMSFPRDSFWHVLSLRQERYTT